jgi:hypothetical protein
MPEGRGFLDSDLEVGFTIVTAEAIDLHGYSSRR